MLRARLSTWGYSVVEARDGLGVVAQCLREQPAAVILDYGMPNGDGQTIARVLRQECDAPIIFVSGYERDHFRSLVLQMPEVYYLNKPVDFSRLEQLLSATIGARAGRFLGRPITCEKAG